MKNYFISLPPATTGFASSSMTLTGHFAAQAPQPMHSAWSMRARWLSTFAAATGHTFWQMPQPIQPAEHTAFVSLPGALEEQRTSTAELSGIIVMMC